MVFILILKVQSTWFARARAIKMHIFISSSPTSLPVSKYRKNGQKFQNLPVQVKIFTEAEPRGIPASVNLISIPHFEIITTKKKVLHQEHSYNSRTIHYIYSPHYLVSGINQWVSCFIVIPFSFWSFQKSTFLFAAFSAVLSSLSLLVFSVVCCLKQNHIGFPLKTLSFLLKK